MRPGGVELEKTEWVPAEAIARFVIPRLVRRLTSAYRAYTSGATLYLEHGQAPARQPNQPPVSDHGSSRRPLLRSAGRCLVVPPPLKSARQPALFRLASGPP